MIGKLALTIGIILLADFLTIQVTPEDEDTLLKIEGAVFAVGLVALFVLVILAIWL